LKKLAEVFFAILEVSRRIDDVVAVLAVYTGAENTDRWLQQSVSKGSRLLIKTGQSTLTGRQSANVHDIMPGRNGPKGLCLPDVSSKRRSSQSEKCPAAVNLKTAQAYKTAFSNQTIF